MIDRMVARSGLMIAEPLARFLEEEALPRTGIAAGDFWRGAAAILTHFAPENAALLAVRGDLQIQLDTWHAAHADSPIDQRAYQAFLRHIGYLVDDPEPFQIDPANVDAEVATLAGPQLVVPIPSCSMPPMPVGAASTMRSTVPMRSPAPPPAPVTIRRAARR